MEDGSTPPARVMQATSPTPEATGETASTDAVKLQQNSTQVGFGTAVLSVSMTKIKQKDYHAKSTLKDSPARESISTEWTDEKHSLYLKSMEASFVDELYNSLDSLGWRSQRDKSLDPKLLEQKHAHNCSSSGQFKVLQSGCWGNIKCERHESQLDKVDQPVNARAKMALTSAALAANSDQVTASHSHLCRYDSVGSITEVSDQNFIDEDIEGEKASRSCNVKRMKTSVAAKPSNDQIVPSGGTFPVSTHVTKNSFSPETEPSQQ
ncbi:hypothetical protein U1Q18_005644 [Sarracenia purpurea var. burkii]